MAEQDEPKPVKSMNVAELKAELRERGVEPDGKNKKELQAMVGTARVEDDTREDDVIVVEPTAEEEEHEHATPAVSEEVKEAEHLALELREKAVGPQATIPALAELNAIAVVAERLASSRIVPSAFYQKPDDVIAAILMGRELGIGPMQSLKDIAVIDGRPALAAHLQLAILRRGGVQILESSVDDDRAYIKARRSDTGEVAGVEWTYAEAETVMRKGKALVDGDNWRNYRRDMLWARAVGRLTRRLGSDLVAGMPYTAEEVRDFEDDPYGYGSGMPTHVEDAPVNPPPKSVPEIAQRLGALLGEDEAREWLIEATSEFGKVEPQDTFGATWGRLSSAQKQVLGQKLAGVVVDLEDRESESGDDLRMSTGVREKVAAVFAARLDGLALHGPMWRLGPDELHLPLPPWAEDVTKPMPEADEQIEFEVKT